MDDARLQQVLDKQEVCEAVYTLINCLDDHDWDALARVTTDDMEVDLSTYRGPGSVYNRAAWLQLIMPFFPRLDATQHLLGNPIVSLAGDRARCRVYLQARHFLHSHAPDSEYVCGGFYVVDLARGDGWQVSRLDVHITWEAGNRAIMTAIEHELAGS